MSKTVPGPRETYDVTCHRCARLFDALSAAWCGCVSLERGLSCPYCSICTCSASSQYKQRMWASAPPALWRRKWSEIRQEFAPGSSGAAGAEEADAKFLRPLVLVVDDEKLVRRVLFETLTLKGYGVVVAEDGVEGLEQARKYYPDVVLADALMPKMDGRELCRRLKDDPATARIKVVVMSGLYTNPRYRNEAQDVFHADDYVCKPIAFDALDALLRKHLAAAAV